MLHHLSLFKLIWIAAIKFYASPPPFFSLIFSDSFLLMTCLALLNQVTVVSSQETYGQESPTISSTLQDVEITGFLDSFPHFHDN